MSITKEKLTNELRMAEKRIGEQVETINALTRKVSEMSVEIASLREKDIDKWIADGKAIMADDLDSMREILTG